MSEYFKYKVKPDHLVVFTVIGVHCKNNIFLKCRQ